jgi:hypothetical protein
VQVIEVYRLPLGAVIAPLAFLIAGNYAEHIKIGLREVPYSMHIPAQIVVPALVRIVLGVRRLLGRVPGDAGQAQRPRQLSD